MQDLKKKLEEHVLSKRYLDECFLMESMIATRRTIYAMQEVHWACRARLLGRQDEDVLFRDRLRGELDDACRFFVTRGRGDLRPDPKRVLNALSELRAIAKKLRKEHYELVKGGK